MNSTVILFLTLVSLTYLVIYFLDKYLKTKSLSYTNFTTKHNIRVHFCYVTLHTKSLNRVIYKIAHLNLTKKCPSVSYTIVYNAGIVCALVSIPASIYIIGDSVYSNLLKPQTLSAESLSDAETLNDAESHYISVKPLVIGVNLPLSHLAYYVASLLVCIVVHELGHAVCALHESVRLNAVGVIIFFVVPVIYVDIENIEKSVVPISLAAKLRIYCAGIWHNVLLSLLAYALLYAFPHVISPLYLVNQGVQVTSIAVDSPLRSATDKLGVENYDVIVRINDCAVTNELTYNKCLLALKPRGFCLPDEFVQKHGTVAAGGCCPENLSKHLCFARSVSGARNAVSDAVSARSKRHVGKNARRDNYQIGKLETYSSVTQADTDNALFAEKSQEIAPILTVANANVTNIDDKSQQISNKTTDTNVCLQARHAIDNSARSCVSDDQCSRHSYCYSPLTSHVLIQLFVRRFPYSQKVVDPGKIVDPKRKVVDPGYILYLGSPRDIYADLSVTGYAQKYTTSRVLAYFPTISHSLAVYVSILSSGLALVNAVPCYYFDAQHIVSVLIGRRYVAACIHAVCSLLLGAYFLLFIPSVLFSTPGRK